MGRIVPRICKQCTDVELYEWDAEKKEWVVMEREKPLMLKCKRTGNVVSVSNAGNNVHLPDVVTSVPECCRFKIEHFMV